MVDTTILLPESMSNVNMSNTKYLISLLDMGPAVSPASSPCTSSASCSRALLAGRGETSSPTAVRLSARGNSRLV